LEQAAKVAEWAQQAKKASAKAGADAKKVQEAATKAGGNMESVLAEVGFAKDAMDTALVQEKKIHSLYDRIYGKALQAAMAEVPMVLPELRKKANELAEKKAKIKAKLFTKQTKAKAVAESVKAAKVYTDLMAGAGKSAAAYAKLGDGLIGQMTNAQMNAGMAQTQANQYTRMGLVAEAQKLYQSSRTDMNMALSLNAQATKNYDLSNKITAQMPAYAGQAAVASYHASVMYDPDAVAPPPPLV